MNPLQSFKNVRTVVFERDSDLRQNIKSALTQDSFTDTAAMSALKSVRAAVFNDDAHLFIIDIDRDEDELCGLMRRIRHHEVGDNPFPMTIAISGDADYENVRKAVNSGFDVLLLKPFSMTTLMDRVHHLMRQRSPFVVTSDYIGPDRRTGTRDKSKGRQPRFVTVPNPLRIMATGESTPEQLRRRIKGAVVKVNESRVQCLAETIATVTEQVASKFLHNQLDEEFVAETKKLDVICRDMGRRLARSRFAHVSELCGALANVVTRIMESPVSPESRDIELLQNMSMAVDRAFQAQGSETATAYRISDTVKAIARDPAFPRRHCRPFSTPASTDGSILAAPFTGAAIPYMSGRLGAARKPARLRAPGNTHGPDHQRARRART